MATVITLTSMINGTLTDVTSVHLSDSAATYGVKRTDTGAVFVAAGTSVVRISPGIYQYTITDPAPDLTYDYVVKIIYGGITYYYPRTANNGGLLNHLYTIPTSSYYSSQAEVMRWLGNPAVDLMMEDWDNDDTSPIWNQILATVDGTIDLYLAQFYAHASVIASPLIRGFASILAAHFLSIRRGNPGLYLREIERVYDQLEQIRLGKLLLIGIAPIGNSAPVVSNYMMQPFALRPARIIQSKSTGLDYVAPKDYAWEPFHYYW